jgi:hypothetical protein
MQQGSGFLLVLAGLLLLWVVVSGKFDLMEAFFLQLFDLPLPANTTANAPLTDATSQAVSNVVSSVGNTQSSLPSSVSQVLYGSMPSPR